MFSVTDSTHGPLATVVLRDEEAGSHATVVPGRGALVTSFVASGREQLYLDEGTLLDPRQNVRGGIPVLFPSPGKLAGDAFTRLGRTGAMKQHGFARTSAFTETGRGTEGSAWAQLELVDSSATRAQYPFGFRLRLRFALSGARLAIRAEVQGSGDGPLPFALGYHPYFAVASADKGKVRIPTGASRAWDNVARAEIAFDGVVDLGGGEVDLHLVDHRANDAALRAPGGDVELDGDFGRWVIWTLPGKEFVCLEPWTAPADALNSGEGLVTLDPGETRTFDLAIVAR